MSNSPFIRQLKSAASVAREAATRNVPVEQVMEERLQNSISRRDFLQKAMLTASVLAVPPTIWNLGTRIVHAEASPRVAVVGAGLAGLTAAYRLKQAGIIAQVYEASTRVGGRCWTKRDGFADGQMIERGGELINSDHTALLQIINELNLQVDDLWAYEKGDFRVIIDGSLYSFEETAKTFSQIWKKLQADARDAGPDTFYNQYTKRGQQLDHMSVVDWINATVPSGMKSKFGKMVDLAYTASVGMESSEISALTLVYGMSQSSKDEFEPFGPSDERYHVHGGNDLVPQGLAKVLKNQIQTSYPLEAIKQNSDGSYTLGFSNGKNTKADYVILALPVATLRNVDISRAGFRDLKNTAIAEMGVATCSKLALQFTDRHWESLGSSGAFVSDEGYQDTWDATRGQSGQSGILVDFTGGKIGDSFGSGSATSYAKDFLKLIEPELPGLSSKWNGKAVLDYWPGYPWAKGSYSCYTVGQYTKFRGIMGEPEGNCFFAGEHTSLKYQQFMNGGVETGERAAQEVLSRLKVTAAI
ncbi:FAD-dependent oxidoreductase [Brevibacillus ginsengisoli]|uniref:flavin monoamine oxidase family protein n=1 Tax=Brevibacillus ginsengisoli TaxID=363854 RepID=UPI003CED59D5